MVQCPRALQGTMCGKEKKQTIRMEVFCDLDMYKWHLFFLAYRGC